MNLDEVRAIGPTLSPWAHLATVRPDNTPDVTPVHPCWEGDTLWLMIGTTSVKARNVATNPNVAIHWQVEATGDGLEVWGTATCHDDLIGMASATDGSKLTKYLGGSRVKLSRKGGGDAMKPAADIDGGLNFKKDRLPEREGRARVQI